MNEQTRSEKFELVYLQVATGTDTISTATVRVKIDGQEKQDAAIGKGPIDATCLAIQRAIGEEVEVKRYSLVILADGSDAVGRVTISAESRGQKVMGVGEDTDIIIASAKAFINALNRLQNNQPN